MFFYLAILLVDRFLLDCYHEAMATDCLPLLCYFVNALVAYIDTMTYKNCTGGFTLNSQEAFHIQKKKKTTRSYTTRYYSIRMCVIHSLRHRNSYSERLSLSCPFILSCFAIQPKTFRGYQQIKKFVCGSLNVRKPVLYQISCPCDARIPRITLPI